MAVEEGDVGGVVVAEMDARVVLARRFEDPCLFEAEDRRGEAREADLRRVGEGDRRRGAAAGVAERLPAFPASPHPRMLPSSSASNIYSAPLCPASPRLRSLRNAIAFT